MEDEKKEVKVDEPVLSVETEAELSNGKGEDDEYGEDHEGAEAPEQVRNACAPGRALREVREPLRRGGRGGEGRQRRLGQVHNGAHDP